jgi:hypothetical protein
MSTRNTDIYKDQEASGGVPETFYTENTLQQEKLSPAGNVPQPPKRPSRNRRGFWFAIAAVVIVLALVFSVLAVFLAQPGKSPSTQVTPTATAPGTTITTTPGSDITPTPSPGVTQGPQNGPIGVNTAAYWDNILGTKGTNGKVEKVSFANVMGNPTLQALVTVRHSDANSTLDVYVFDKVTSKNPVQIFNLNGLIKGEAKISYYNSIMTAEVDQNSTLNTGKTVSQMTPDLFREFAWSNGAMSQVAFPGIFPEMTRYQAELAQASVNAGNNLWKEDPAQVAKALEERFFHWQRAVTTKVLSGGGPKDVYATVQVQEAPIQSAHLSFVVTLSRLEGNTYNHWVAIGVTDGSTLTLKNITPRQLISSPVTLEGMGSAYEAQIGQAVVYDHLYTDIGHAQIMGSKGFGEGTYNTQVSYTSSFHGVQEGMVTVYENNAGMSAENATAVMMKVLISPTPSVNDPSYWTQFVSVPPNIRVANSVSFAHLLGNSSIQAVVVATDILGGGPVYRDVFVFDKITDPKPQLLWQVNHLLHGNAQISGYSTVMTKQVDINSSINQGKLDAMLTTDLYREFQWSGKAGTFVQVAFPGFYPDLTRWQAEADQLAVNQGKDSWKLNAVESTKRFAIALLRTPADSTVKLVSGGGARDVYAVVTVTPPVVPGGGGPFAPIKVTLTRLEGNIGSGIWIVIGVESTGKTLTVPKTGSLISSPVTVTGSGSQFESQIGIVHILDHLYTDIGHAIAMGTAGFGIGPFSIEVPYKASFHGGAQEGIVVLYDENGGGLSLRGGVAMVKVLMNG